MGNKSFTERLGAAIRTHVDNNQILSEDMQYFAHPSRAERTIDTLMREIGVRGRYAEADRANLDHCRVRLAKYRDLEADMYRKQSELEMLISHYKTMNEAIVAITIPLSHLADRLDGDPEAVALAQGIRDYLDRSMS